MIMHSKKENILTSGFVFHLIYGIIEILDWDRNKIWCRDIGSEYKYVINSNSWNIIRPLTEEQKKMVYKNDENT